MPLNKDLLILVRRKLKGSPNDVFRVQVSNGAASEFLTLDRESIESLTKFFSDLGFENIKYEDHTI